MRAALSNATGQFGRHHMAQPFVDLEAPDDDQDLLQPVSAAQPAPRTRHVFDSKTRC